MRSRHPASFNSKRDIAGLCATKDFEPLLALIAQCKVGQRPGRIEPRMRKRRPKPYPWLKVPRVQARREVAKHGHAQRAK
jgi:hypothetical protein